jgi:hypothetical protein
MLLWGMNMKQAYYAVYDSRTTTGYKCLGVVKTPTTGKISMRDYAYQVVSDELGLTKDDVYLVISVEIQYTLLTLGS